MSFLPWQEHVYRQTAKMFIDWLADASDRRDPEKVLEGLRAAGELLRTVGDRWAALDAAWEENHDWLVLGVPLEEPPRGPTMPRAVPPPRWCGRVPKSNPRLGAGARMGEAAAVECSYCRAAVGVPCFTVTGKRSPEPHMVRARRTYLKRDRI